MTPPPPNTSTEIRYRAAEYLARRQQEVDSRQIVYKRGGESHALVATVGRQAFRFEDLGTGQLRVEWTDRDFFIRRADWNESPYANTMPLPGDIIEENDGLKVLRYEVAAPNNEQVWRWADDYYVLIRVHTKRTPS